MFQGIWDIRNNKCIPYVNGTMHYDKEDLNDGTIRTERQHISKISDKKTMLLQNGIFM